MACHNQKEKIVEEIFTKIVRTYCGNGSTDQENFLRSLEQFIQAVQCKVRKCLVTECFFIWFLEVSHKFEHFIIIQIGKHYWGLETCRKSYKKIVP